ncbi:MAG: MGMT family protein [Candidatus Micrarchaeota archaeon]|nr:MGMT family protein [Candidatus Micrarchaeota archaeon]MDE1847654.1 MGMT family protein [Candidatus Micrarchaeota archaeon]MDE1864475.1 MGMT family protein [Candidatus Micrarchaeota archaeon]
MGLLRRMVELALWFYGFTEFERLVLLNTFDIKRGTTVSYKELASKSGRPRAFRAVGNIMNKNPLPLLIPCHRVVASNCKLGGYAYGTWAKRLLLAAEGTKL